MVGSWKRFTFYSQKRKVWVTGNVEIGGIGLGFRIEKVFFEGFHRKLNELEREWKGVK